VHRDICPEKYASCLLGYIVDDVGSRAGVQFAELCIQFIALKRSRDITVYVLAIAAFEA
jgi:hypothetical protein